ncbi:hypothetical protein AB0B45_28880 [Nonomuraea sp. NPDC049152]|uniref:hypothetical protein n=1 Tax=Nonomuraea sp. NPDC049152 TaxID=3154350 RepID=UPI00340CB13F
MSGDPVDWSSLSGAQSPKKSDPNFKMQSSGVRQLGKDYSSHSDDLDAMSTKTSSIDLPALTFGAIGYGLVTAHNNVRDNTVDALKQGKDVLDSFRTALAGAADNKDLADEASKTRGGDEKGGPDLSGLKSQLGGGPKIPTGKDLGLDGLGGKGPKLPDQKLPDHKLPDQKLPDQKLPDHKLPDHKLPDQKLPDQKLPDQKLPDQKLPDHKLPDQPQMPDSKLPQQPQIPDPKGIDTSGLNQRPANPIESKLASYDPSAQDLLGRTPNSSAPQSGTSFTDPRGGSGVSYGAGAGAGAGAGTGALGGAGARGMTGGGMPMYSPMAPGMGGGTGEQDKDRDGSKLLKGNPDDYEDDQDIAPPVLGKE